jgi:hypothetical protein
MEDTPWNQAVARAIKDPAFRARLLSDPAATLKEAGVESPAASGSTSSKTPTP